MAMSQLLIRESPDSQFPPECECGDRFLVGVVVVPRPDTLAKYDGTYTPKTRIDWQIIEATETGWDDVNGDPWCDWSPDDVTFWASLPAKPKGLVDVDELRAIILELYRWQAGVNELLPDGLGDRIVAVLGTQVRDNVLSEISDIDDEVEPKFNALLALAASDHPDMEAFKRSCQYMSQRLNRGKISKGLRERIKAALPGIEKTYRDKLAALRSRRR